MDENIIKMLIDKINHIDKTVSDNHALLVRVEDRLKAIEKYIENMSDSTNSKLNEVISKTRDIETFIEELFVSGINFKFHHVPVKKYKQIDMGVNVELLIKYWPVTVFLLSYIAQTISAILLKKDMKNLKTVMEIQLKNMVTRLDKQNGRVGKLEDWQEKHLEKFHAK